MSSDIVTRMRANAEVAEMRRTGIRPPHIRPWGIAAGAQPYRRGTSSAVGWWVFVAAVAACAIAIMVAI